MGSVNGVLCHFSNRKSAADYEYDLRFSKVTLSREIITFSGIPDFLPDGFNISAYKMDIYLKFNSFVIVTS